MGKLKINGTIPVFFTKERESVVAFSPALDFSTCGQTIEEAKKNFAEALEIFFEECIKMNTLDEVLESCGWVKDEKRGWEPPAYIGEDRVEIPHFATAISSALA